MKYAPDGLERCHNHPEALVRHVFDRTVYTLNLVETHTLCDRTVKFECAECGRELRVLESVSETARQ